MYIKAGGRDEKGVTALLGTTETFVVLRPGLPMLASDMFPHFVFPRIEPELVSQILTTTTVVPGRVRIMYIRMPLPVFLQFKSLFTSWMRAAVLCLLHTAVAQCRKVL